MTNVINLFADDKGKCPVDAVQHQRQTIQSFLERLDYAQKCFMGLAQRHDAWVSELRGAARLAANAHAEDTQGRTYSFLRDFENFEEELCEAARLAGHVPANVGWREEQLPAEEQEAFWATKSLPIWVAMDGGHFKDANGNYLIKSYYSDTAQLGYYRVLKNVAEGRSLSLGKQPTLDAAKESAEMNASGRPSQAFADALRKDLAALGFTFKPPSQDDLETNGVPF